MLRDEVDDWILKRSSTLGRIHDHYSTWGKLYVQYTKMHKDSLPFLEEFPIWTAKSRGKKIYKRSFFPNQKHIKQQCNNIFSLKLLFDSQTFSCPVFNPIMLNVLCDLHWAYGNPFVLNRVVVKCHTNKVWLIYSNLFTDAFTSHLMPESQVFAASE